MTDLVPAAALPAGWYLNADGRRQWWDGTAWTNHFVHSNGTVVPFDQLDLLPAGWYPDEQGVIRWWDGTQWTAQTHNPSAPASKFSGLVVQDRWIYYGNEAQEIAGVRAYVETAGELYRRSTLTRTAVGGLAFGPAGLIVGALFRKKKDLRELYIMIDGPRYAWVVSVNPKQGLEARRFAAFIANSSNYYLTHPV